MGSIESGRRYAPNEVKSVVENQISINILDLNKKGFLKAGIISIKTYSLNSNITGWIITTAAPEYLRLDYLCNGAFLQQTIQITSTLQNYGGSRPYLACPSCDSKRVSLYLGQNGQFACRICHGFVFRSTQLNPHLRHSHRADKFLERLGGTDFILHGKRPPGMWGRTFFKLQGKYFTHRIKSCDLFVEYFDEIFKKYGSVVAEKKRMV